MIYNNKSVTEKTTYTNGGASIGRDVNTDGGNFAGRDQINIFINTTKDGNLVQNIYTWWESWSSITEPAIIPALLLSGRLEELDTLVQFLSDGPRRITIRSESYEESLAFIASVIQSQSLELTDSLIESVLIIECKDTWNSLVKCSQPLILIPSFTDDVLINLAIKHNHIVIIPLSRGYPGKVDIDLPRIRASEAQKILEKQAVAHSRDLARLIRRSLAAYQRLQANPSLEIPKWAYEESGIRLLMPLLVGKWDEKVKDDKKALELLTSESYKGVSDLLIRWKGKPDAPFRKAGSLWYANVKEDAWQLLSRYATNDDIKSFIDFAIDVLSKPDPQRGLNVAERLMADIDGNRRPYSATLRSGLVDSLAMLGMLGHSSITPDHINITSHVDFAVRSLLEHAQTENWFDIVVHLPELAEAAPDVFLEIIESDIGSTSPTLLSLFDPLPGLISSDYNFQYLLWALERLAWSPIHFPRVATVTAKLVAIAPKTKIINSPYETLLSFYRLWLPQCGAEYQARLETLDRIRIQEPYIAWSLMISLLPRGYDATSTLGGPGTRATLWRNWPSEANRPSDAGYCQAAIDISARLIEDVDIETVRWLDMVQYLHLLSPNLHNTVIDKLEDASHSISDSKLRVELWNLLRRIVTDSQIEPGCQGRFSEDSLNHLDKIINLLTPDNLSEQYQWLFNGHPRLPVDRRAQIIELEKQRIIAVQKIYDSEQLDAVFAFALNIENVNDLGRTLAQINLKEHDVHRIITNLSHPTIPREMVKGFIYIASSLSESIWIDKFLNFEVMKPWTNEIRALAFSSLPFTIETLDRLEECDSGTQQAYWRMVTPPWNDEPDILLRSINALLLYERPRYILSMLTWYIDLESKLLTPEIVQRVLYSALCVPMEKDSIQINPDDVGMLLAYLKTHPDTDRNILGQLEWLYICILHYVPNSLYLYELLSQEPAFFAHIVRLLYGNGDEENQPPIDSDDRLKAYCLLDSWKSVPGRQSKNDFDGGYLKKWIDQVLVSLKEAELTQEGLGRIGAMLRWGPSEDEDGIWPHPIICDIIEGLSSESVDASFRLSLYNSRGITTRGQFDGGEQELQLEAKYRDYAETLNARWPRVARILRKIAGEYQEEALQYDQKAQVFEDMYG